MPDILGSYLRSMQRGHRAPALLTLLATALLAGMAAVSHAGAGAAAVRAASIAGTHAVIPDGLFVAPGNRSQRHGSARAPDRILAVGRAASAAPEPAHAAARLPSYDHRHGLGLEKLLGPRAPPARTASADLAH
jgi:hypothetical protein